MKFVQKVEPVYVDGGTGEFSILDSVNFEKDRFILNLRRTEWNSAALGTLSTLESPTEIVFTKRSQEVDCYPGKLSCFGGGTPFGLYDFEEWTRERVQKESNYLQSLEFIGLVSDNVEGSTLLAYRGHVDKIDRSILPSVVKSQYGKIKYSELMIVPKTDLREFLRENKPRICDSLEPVISYIVCSGQIKEDKSSK